MSLDLYHKKRNFTKTVEPFGQEEKTDSALLHFVVQEHHARRLHYDFRLEMAGVLKSWTVPKIPPLKSTEKRLAIQVEDHPFDYLNFEGEIATGNYGAGTVKIWDQGTYEADKPLNQLEQGKLVFNLKGKKMKGYYTLLKTSNADQENHWLILKNKDKK